ncbi:MAG: hypothetical protein PHE73_09080 [Sulfurovaceae bacterium]|nr:hypothetical protein [Sulfurovaceae bacterium]
MKQAIVTLWGSYKYKISLTGNESMHDVAMKIALEVHRKEGKTKFTGTPRAFNYVYECLLRKSCFNFRLNAGNNQNNEQELLKAANDLNSKTEFIKVVCPECKAQGMITDKPRGNHLFGACPKCGGHGYLYEKQEYRLGYTQSNTLIIDIDGKDKENLIRVKTFYEAILKCKFKVIMTKNGYWLFSDKKYSEINEWLYDHCRVLNPMLAKANYEAYKIALLKLDEGNNGTFQRATPEVIKVSELYFAPKDLNFDIAFTFLSIKRQRSTIRITKKSKDDKIEEVKL